MHHSEQNCIHVCSEWRILGYGTGALWEFWYWPFRDMLWSHCCWIIVIHRFSITVTIGHQRVSHPTVLPRNSLVLIATVFFSMMSSSNGNIFPYYWPFVRGIHRSPVDASHKCQWREALKFSLICTWTNGWTNDRGADNLRDAITLIVTSL